MTKIVRFGKEIGPITCCLQENPLYYKETSRSKVNRKKQTIITLTKGKMKWLYL